ncbi:MAG: hypothetical protein COU51_00020 [Parcubacteria group bacterium CG10_big_fil_rev_8_21_14_0_10_36_14]|nr:MAG: hypothetical protein COU51_00020 [Parcubacteria group bacterium CG10_big_fil_rev_8_21_14_0_10_36_14]
MKIHFVFLTALIAIVLALVVCTGGCATPMPQYGESLMDAHNRGLAFRGSLPHYARYQAPTPPANAGFLHRPPVGWEKSNPRSLRIVNESETMGARCWLDGRAILPVSYGAVARAPVVTKAGVVLVPMTPPYASSSHIVDMGEHLLKCQLYVGPLPFQLAYEMQLTIRTDWGGKEIHLRPDLSPMHPINRMAEN